MSPDIQSLELQVAALQAELAEQAGKGKPAEEGVKLTVTGTSGKGRKDCGCVS